MVSRRKNREGRPSPAISANDLPGQIRRGGNGKLWESRKTNTEKGYYQWKPYPSKTKQKKHPRKSSKKKQPRKISKKKQPRKSSKKKQPRKSSKRTYTKKKKPRKTSAKKKRTYTKRTYTMKTMKRRGTRSRQTAAAARAKLHRPSRQRQLKGRASPPHPAAMFKGKVMKGKHGVLWLSKKIPSTGYYRWVKY